MKIVLVLIFVALMFIGLFRLMQTHSRRRPVSQVSSDNPYEMLHNAALHTSRSEIGLPPASTPTQAWGAIMDWGLPEGTATVVSFSDGSASLYLSSGGGFLGGISHESVRKAAQKMVATANENQAHMLPTKTYPIPTLGQMTFYILTDAGTLTASASQDDLMNHRSSLSTLGDAAQEVITEINAVDGH